MVHKLATPLQHQTADLVQNHVISRHHQCKSSRWPALLNPWCNRCRWCASDKKQGRFWARNCHHFSAPCNQCATTTWSWPSCREVGYNRDLLNLPRGIRIYSYRDGDDAKDGNTRSKWWLSIDGSEIQDMNAPKDADKHGDATDQFNLSPPCWLQWSGNQHVCISNTTTSSRRFVHCLPFDLEFFPASYWSCDWSPWTYFCNAQCYSPIIL